MSAPSTTLSTHGGLWAASALAVANLLREIAMHEVLPRWQSVDVEHKADGSLLSAADTAVQVALAKALPTIYAAQPFWRLTAWCQATKSKGTLCAGLCAGLSVLRLT